MLCPIFWKGFNTVFQKPKFLGVLPSIRFVVRFTGVSLAFLQLFFKDLSLTKLWKRLYKWLLYNLFSCLLTHAYVAYWLIALFGADESACDPRSYTVLKVQNLTSLLLTLLLLQNTQHISGVFKSTWNNINFQSLDVHCITYIYSPLLFSILKEQEIFENRIRSRYKQFTHF